jgi:hypothetical protein
VPPGGWQRPAEDRGRGSLLETELAEVLLALAGTLRDRLPAELEQRLLDAVRELLLAVRALIDWYLERTARSWREPPEVTEIPIL